MEPVNHSVSLFAAVSKCLKLVKEPLKSSVGCGSSCKGRNGEGLNWPMSSSAGTWVDMEVQNVFYHKASIASIT